MAHAGHPARTAGVRRSLWSGLIAGAGLMGAVDEIVFHQLLHWHHFYDRSTPDAGLVSDGFLHAATLTAVVVGLFLLADLRRGGAWAPGTWAGGLLVGAAVLVRARTA